MLLGEAVSIQRLDVPDLLVIDQHHHQNQPRTSLAKFGLLAGRPDRIQNTSSSEPETASLINPQDPSIKDEITFECLITFDPRRDKNLIVKWHHDDRIEPIYQWIPELNKRSIAPQYRAHIEPMVAATNLSSKGRDSAAGQMQLLEAGFKLVKPSKELGGKSVDSLWPHSACRI